MSESDHEFKEIGHCGGQYKIIVKITPEGRRTVSFGIHHSLPVPAVYFGVYFHPDGGAVSTINLGGIGQPWNPPPVTGCFPIYIGSDRTGMFGHECQRCNEYWRSDHSPAHWPMTCPYCGYRAGSHAFLSESQLRYAQACCECLEEASSSEQAGEFIVDMDPIADATSKECKKPKLCCVEISQQNNFVCSECGGKNDILGKYGYCSSCGTFNGLSELKSDLNRIHERMPKNAEFNEHVKDAISAFDSFARQIAKQLAARIPMTPAQKTFWETRLFHNLKFCSERLAANFDINALKNLSADEIAFIVKMFYRRHVYEHNGGEVDERYISESGDKSVKPKQVIRETAKTAQQTISLILKIAEKISEDFHAIFPPEEKPIKYHQQQIKTRTHPSA